MSTDQPEQQTVEDLDPEDIRHAAELERRLREADIDLGELIPDPERRSLLSGILGGAVGAVGAGGGLLATSRPARAGTQSSGQVGMSSSSVDVEAEDVGLRQLSGVARAADQAELEQNLSAADRRAVTVFLTSTQQREWSVDSTIEFGQMTKLVGESNSFGETTGYDYHARPELRFASGVTGFKGDTDADYRVQAPHFEGLTIAGQGPADGQTGIHLIGAVNSTAVDWIGLTDVIRCTVEGWQRGVDGESADAGGVNIERSSFTDCTYGVYNLGKKGSVGKRTVFWRIKNSGAAIRVIGNLVTIENAQFEITNANADCIQIQGGPNGHAGKIVDNIHDQGRDFRRFVNNDLNNFNTAHRWTVANNTVDGTPNDSLVYASGNKWLVVDNDFASAIPPSASYTAIVFQGNDCTAAYNAMPGSGSWDYAAYTDGARNAFIGNSSYHDGIWVDTNAVDTWILDPSVRWSDVDDSGTRTVLNHTSYNNGNPASSGQWNGNADLAFHRNVRVRDASVSPQVWYVPRFTGSGHEWRELNTTAA